MQNAEQTLAERIRRVENLRRTIEKQWQANCGFSREMSKALVNRIVVDADESKTCITLDVFLTAGREFGASRRTILGCTAETDLSASALRSSGRV